MDIALQSHSEIAHGREVCDQCHTKCGQVHVPPSAARGNGAGSRAHTPLTSPAKPGGSTGGVANGAGTANGKESKPDNGNIMLECVNCKRPVASTRYAQHLSGCLGLAGARRGNARTAVTKAKQGSDGRSASPYVGSELGVSDEELSPAKAKPKPKNKKAQVNGTKRPLSPDHNSSPPAKKLKKQQSQPKLPPSSSINGSLANGIAHSQVKVPSKLQQQRPPPAVPHPTYSQSRTTDSSPDSGSSDSAPPSPKPIRKPLHAPTTSKTLPGSANQQQWTLPSTNALTVNRRPSAPQSNKATSAADEYGSTSSLSS